MKYLIFIYIGLLLSCSNKQKEKYESVAEKGPDTLYQSTSNIVYKDVKFGISKNEYEKSVPTYLNQIGNTKYMLDPVFNDNDSLVCLSFTSIDKTANFVDTEVKDDMNNLKRVIESKYSLPQINFGEINFLDFKPNNIQWKYGWKLYTKMVLIGMIESRNGKTYSAVMWIYDKPSYERYRNNKEEKATENYSKESSDF